MVKIPSALKWMLDRRARLLGEIQKIEKRQTDREAVLAHAINALEKRLQTLKRRLHISRSGTPKRIAALRVDLSAIDGAMGQHRVMVEADSIPPIRSQDNPWHLPHGQMTRLIFRALRETPDEELTTGEIALFVAAESQIEIGPSHFRPFKIAVRRRLRNLHADGMVRRVEIGKNAMDSRWTRAPDR